jgi:hypothetical protein
VQQGADIAPRYGAVVASSWFGLLFAWQLSPPYDFLFAWRSKLETFLRGFDRAVGYQGTALGGG